MTRKLDDHELTYWFDCSETIYPRLRRVLVERDGDGFQICGASFGDATPDIDHIIPRFKPGYSGDQWNLRLACRPCNSSSLNTQPLADRYEAARAARHRIGDFRSDEQVVSDEHAEFVRLRLERRARKIRTLGRLVDVRGAA